MRGARDTREGILKMTEAVLFDAREDGIAILTMDVPGDSMNTLKADFGDEVERAVSVGVCLCADL